MKNHKVIFIILLFTLLLSISLNIFLLVNLQNKQVPYFPYPIQKLKFKCKKVLLSEANKEVPGGRKLYLISIKGKTAYLVTQAYLYKENDYSIDHLVLNSPLMYFDCRMILFAEMPEDWEKSFSTELCSGSVH